jgi:xanthine/uracil permease
MVSHIISKNSKQVFETMGQAEPHFQTIFFTILMECPFDRIHFFSNFKGCAHPMLNLFSPIVVGEFVLIMCISIIKMHPHWKMGMASPLELKHYYNSWFFNKKNPKMIGVKKTTLLI